MLCACAFGRAPSIVASKELRMSKRNRNRIVINLDKLPGGSGKRPGLARLLLIFAVVLLLLASGVAVGGYLWWRNYQRSPAYSLALLADASQRNDNATVDSL